MNWTWRDKCKPIIAKVIEENKELPEKELRKKISAEYPFYEREHHPYKIWLSEVKTQLTRHFIKEKQIPPGGLFDTEE